MREILFRGKRVDNGEWVYGAYSAYSSRLNCDNGTVEYEVAFMPSIIAYDDECRWYHVDPATVGQYTGLTDKNGKRIFEGDIVAQNWYDHEEPADDSFGEVVFCEYDCSFSVIDAEKDGIVPLGRCHAYHWEAEIIGNIHDNPEMLEGGATHG